MCSEVCVSNPPNFASTGIVPGCLCFLIRTEVEMVTCACQSCQLLFGEEPSTRTLQMFFRLI